jgi:NADPH-dependent glutamate synthase beta subunit-like oxidoreductase/Pyruvate/2-oxoacid:ferredoxin oxidoreductase delta subunit
MNDSSFNRIPLFIPHSSTSTKMNKTGSWRFFHPKFDEKTAPCSAACPLGQDVARIEMLTSWGLLKDAWQTILNENPFPAICGRVCFHPCESACNRAHMDEPIAIHHLERFLGDTAISEGREAHFNIKPANGKKVAIAGAGPAGLAAAYFLTRLGYGCEVFEARSEPGGLLRWGIPAYRLPPDILNREISRIKALGVTIHCETPVTEDLLGKIRSEYNALFVACGYERSITLKIQGGDLARDGLEFLRNLDPAAKTSLGGTAAIVGGGNTAVDIARSLIRRGVSPLIVYRRRLEDMPAFEPETATAVKEGVKIMELVAPLRIQKNVGDSSSSLPGYRLTLQKMKVGKEKIAGRAWVVPDEEKTETIDVQDIFVAIGAKAEAIWHFLEAEGPKTLDLRHCRLIEQNTPVVFGGDLTSPVKSVTDAVASGKQAAMALDTYFKKGLDAVEKRLAACRVGAGPAMSMDTYLGGDRKYRNGHIVDPDEIVLDYFQSAPRVIPSSLDAPLSIRSFEEINTTYVNDAAKKEAARCFNCGICNACDFCRLYCPEMAVIIDKAERRINLDYCKGCGVCATECPRNAMTLEEEIK